MLHESPPPQTSGVSPYLYGDIVPMRSCPCQHCQRYERWPCGRPKFPFEPFYPYRDTHPIYCEHEFVATTAQNCH